MSGTMSEVASIQKHLYMKGKYNSLFALDKHLLDESDQLKEETGIKWNRLVVNLL